MMILWVYSALSDDTVIVHDVLYGCHGTASAVGRELASRRGPKIYDLYVSDDQALPLIFFGSTACEYGTRHLEEVAQNAWLVKRAEDYLFFTPTVDGLASEQARLLTYPLASYWRNGFKQCSSGTVDRQTPGSFNAGGNGQFIDAADRPVTFPTNAHKHTRTHTHSATCWSWGCCRPSTISQWRFKPGWHA